jgi:iron complex outermembrane receptor protein
MNNMPVSYRFAQFTLFCSALLSFLPANLVIAADSRGEERAESEEQERESPALEEIVVTATKREENLQSVALSITAFSRDFLEDSNISDLDDLETRVPNFTYDTFSPGVPVFNIRGIGDASRSGAVDTAVGVFVDEVYMGRPVMMNADFHDIERVEILRGPQGTLFGRNVVGGAVSFYTSRPSEEVVANLSMTYGKYDQRDAKGFVSGPISENVFGKISVVTRNHDGYAFNATTDNDIEDDQFFGARAALRFVPDDSLDIQLNVDTSRRRATGLWWDLIREGPFAIGQSNPDPRRGRNHDDDGFSDSDVKGASLHIDWESGFGTVTSITAYREAEMSDRANTTGLFVAELTDPNRFLEHFTLFIQQADMEAEQVSQEVRIASDLNSRFNWVAGAFYFHEEVDQTRIQDYRFHFFNIEGQGIFNAETDTDAYAFFANGTYNFTDALSLQAGIRWSEDNKDHILSTGGVNYIPYTVNGAIVPGWIATGDGSWDAFTPSFSLNYHVTDEHFLYATVSRGFKSGGFNDLETERAAAELPFAPEFAWNYEIGAKTEWFDRRLRFNASAFYLDYTDLQVTVVLQPDPNFPPIFVTGNAGSAEVKGVETEWTLVPFDGATLYGSYTFTDSELKNLFLGPVDASGNKLSRAPKHKLFLGGDFTFPVTDFANATIRMDYTYTDETFNTLGNSPVERIPSKETLDASLAFATTDGRWELVFWGKNLFDELAINTITEVPVLNGYGTFEPPRTYGATVRFNY